MTDTTRSGQGGVTGVTPVPAPEWIGRHWIWIAALGAILMAGGILALLMPIAAGIAATIVIGACLVVGGALQLVHAIRSRGWSGRGWHAAGGVIYIVGGALILLQPLIGVIALSLLLMATLIVQGVTRVIAALRMRPSRRWAWVAASGALSVLVALLALLALPLSSLTLIGVFTAALIAIEGAALIYFAFAARPRGDRTVMPDAGERYREA